MKPNTGSEHFIYTNTSKGAQQKQQKDGSWRRILRAATLIEREREAKFDAERQFSVDEVPQRFQPIKSCSASFSRSSSMLFGRPYIEACVPLIDASEHERVFLFRTVDFATRQMARVCVLG